MAGYRLTVRDDGDRSLHPIVPVRLGLKSRGVILQNNIAVCKGLLYNQMQK
jgi:hypothetical protein